MKKIIALALSLVLLFSVAAFAVDARSATETARALAPKGSVYLYTEKDGKNYEIHFLNEASGEEFEISVPTEEGKAVKIETENDFAPGSTGNTITEEDVRQAVLNEYPDAQIDSIFTVKEDGLFEVHVYFTAYDHFGRVKLNAETGSLIERKIILSTPLAGWQSELDDDYFEDTWASEGVSSDAADSRNTSPSENSASSSDKEKSSGSNNSSSNKSSGNSNSSSNKSSGKSSSNKSSSGKDSLISVSQAKSAVTSRHPGAKIVEIELDYDDGKYVYEGEARLNGREYDFKVNATTGSLIKWKLDD